MSQGEGNDLKTVIEEALRLASEGSFDEGLARLDGLHLGDDERQAVEEARARIEEQRGIGQA